MRNTPRRVMAILVAAATTLGLAPAAAFAAPTIDHDPVQCIVAGSYPEFIAGFSPSAEVASARLYFKASDTPDWYWVPFNSESAGSWKAVLPKPSPSLRQIDYYLSALDAESRPTNGDQHHPVVSTRTYCENQALTVAQPLDLEGIELAVGLVRVAQQVIPSGFFSEGIATTILADGTAVATSTAAQSSSTAAVGGTSTGSAAGAAGSAAAVSGGISTTAWVLGGVALAGGAAYALSEGQKDDDGGSSAVPTHQWSSYSIPSNPSANQDVTIVVDVNRSGVTVVYSVVGTDGWRQNGSAASDSSGEIRFVIPAAGRPGVSDTVTVSVPEWGPSYVRTFTYTFH